MRSSHRVELIAIPNFAMVRQGDELAKMIVSAVAVAGGALLDGDIVVIAQKIVSKAEGRLIELRSVIPSSDAVELSRKVAKDPRLVHLILSELRRVLRAAPNILIVQHRLGFIMANAGIDQSNVASPDEPEAALLLPIDPDASAFALRRSLVEASGAFVGVIINDSFGRPWRRGTVGIALGVAGVPAVIDKRGEMDLFNRPLKVTVIGFADEIAAAASFVMGQADEGLPVVIVRGVSTTETAQTGRHLLRPDAEDLFR